MSEAIRVAVPSEAPGGLDARPSAHFGHCAAYTLATVANGAISDVTILSNDGHGHNCLAPVDELAKAGVKVLLAGGMGARPLAAMKEAGISVYHNTDNSTVAASLEAFAAGKLTPFGDDQLCRGCGGHHH